MSHSVGHNTNRKLAYVARSRRPLRPYFQRLTAVLYQPDWRYGEAERLVQKSPFWHTYRQRRRNR